MSDYDLTGGSDSIGLNSHNTIGVMAHDHITTNQTRTSLFTPEYLLEWAKAVNDAYGDEPAVEVVFTPHKPMVAHLCTDEGTSIGVGVAPRVKPDEYEDLVGDENE